MEQLIFYSWQSDLPREINNDAIRIAMEQALLNIKKKLPDLRTTLDEATRNEPGSPHIPSTIFKKITHADIFLADITPINSEITDSKIVANPNVLIELGYAISVLGWERIVLVFNKRYGDFPRDLPFDIDRQRTLDFIIKDDSDKSGKGQLAKELTDLFSTIITQNPTKPNEKSELSVSEKHRLNDVDTIDQLTKSIHMPTIDEFLKDMPDFFQNRVFFFWIEFSEKADSSYFNIYDEELKKVVDEFKKVWSQSLSFGHSYNYSWRTDRHVFYAPGDLMNKEQEANYNKLSEIMPELYKNYREMLEHIRCHWPEVDLKKNSDYAIMNYKEYLRDGISQS